MTPAVEIKRKWLTVKEVAYLLQFSQSKVKMLVITGRLKSVKDGRNRRILPEWVDDYIRSVVEVNNA